MSMATGGSSVGSLPMGQHSVYDLAVERDVIVLLRAIHVSTLPLDIKNYLRDLVFMVRFGDRPTVDQALIATFATHGFSVAFGAVNESAPEVAHVMATPPPAPPQVEVAPPTPPRASGFGIVRPAPTFTPVKPSTVTAPASVGPVESVATPPPAPAQAVGTAPTTPPPAAAVAAPEDVPPVAPAAPAPVSVKEEPIAPVSGLNPSERIAEIKRAVNALVGNPVNLIDVNNEVGREYMNALLDAMKKSLGTTPANEVERAMARLERSFISVKETLAGTAPSVPPEVPATAPALEQRTEPELVVETPAVVPEPVHVPPPQPVPEQQPEPEPEPAAPAELPAVPEPVPQSGFVSVADTLDTPPVATTATEVPGRLEQTLPVEAATPATDEVITPVAKEKQLRELMEARKAAEAVAARQRAEAAQHNPLMADDVNAGLKQLLSEWKLFKSSGIFGTGPSGDEHPLYKKLAPLTMAAVLAGRFEGATPDVKRSIADYMNGWRYEEGVTHEQGETFEVYLRRVIRHILDKHKAAT